MSRALYNATVLPEVVRLMKEHYQISEEDALEKVYESETMKALNDPETGLYGQSALFIYSLLLNEKE